MKKLINISDLEKTNLKYFKTKIVNENTVPDEVLPIWDTILRNEKMICYSIDENISAPLFIIFTENYLKIAININPDSKRLYFLKYLNVSETKNKIPNQLILSNSLNRKSIELIIEDRDRCREFKKILTLYGINITPI